MSKIEIPQDSRRQLAHVGVQGIVFAQKPFALDSQVGIITGATKTGKPRNIRKQEQIDAFAKVLSKPLHTPYTMCIASAGTDMRAKYAAAFLLLRGVEVHSKLRRDTNRLSPLWHVVTGSYMDEVRDRGTRPGKRPAMLVLTNITADSSEVKVEKLRDLLELYSDIPRIVTLTGTDPVTFFNTRLDYPLNFGLYLNVASRGMAQNGRPPKEREEREEASPKRPKPGRKPISSATTEI